MAFGKSKNIAVVQELGRKKEKLTNIKPAKRKKTNQEFSGHYNQLVRYITMKLFKFVLRKIFLM